MKKNIAILGSTGSVGTQALEVIRTYADRFSVQCLSASSNADLLIQQARVFKPAKVVIVQEALYDKVKQGLADLPIQVEAGAEALEILVTDPQVDIVLTAVVGFAGLLPTLQAIAAGKDIALANKETMVVAGDLVMREARKHQVQILPVDSEHSAIFQCLIGEDSSAIDKIILTASGGPFRGKDRTFLEQVTPQQALKHPNWDMGAKITVDSASLMNKGLEAIEARWLFNVKPEQIEVIVHSQSIVHSLVEFQDGSLKAQMGRPDMRLPIQVALSYPDRLPSQQTKFSFLDYPELNFEPADLQTFENLDLAFKAMHMGGIMPCVLNAANEVAVAAFLRNEIGFLDMSAVVSYTLNYFKNIEQPSLQDYMDINTQSRQVSEAQIKTIKEHSI